MHELVYIVDDEIDILNLVSIALQKEQFQTKIFSNPKDFFLALESNIPDLILLDLMLPEINGLDICKQLKNNEKFHHIPIIFLSAKSDEFDKVLGLEIGADDYITKPFSNKELSTRVKVILRRYKLTALSQKTNDGIDTNNLRFENLSINQLKHEITINDEPVYLTATEFKIITILVQNPKAVITRNNLLDKLWDNKKIVSDRTIDVHIQHLRNKLGTTIGERIKSIHGVGYKLE